MGGPDLLVAHLRHFLAYGASAPRPPLTTHEFNSLYLLPNDVDTGHFSGQTGVY